jgi:hypothetical protein
MMRFSRGLEILLCFALAVSGVVDARPPHTGASIMNTSEQAFLERYNQPELFLVDTNNLNVQQIVWKYKDKEAVFTRPDGVEVRIMKGNNSVMGNRGMHYMEDMTYPASPYSYRNTYDENGILLYKSIRFYGSDFYSIYECKDGKCVILSSPYNKVKNPLFPIGQTRKALRKEVGIDLYDTSVINRAVYFTDDKFKPYYELTMRGLKREMLVDAETGKALYERGFLPGIEANATVPGTAEMEESPAYLKSEELVKKHIENDQTVFRVYKKHGTRDRNRFYEILLKKPYTPSGIPLVSFLLDHKTEKILYRYEMRLPKWPIGGLPYVPLWDEYQQHLKMREAEEESGSLSGP